MRSAVRITATNTRDLVAASLSQLERFSSVGPSGELAASSQVQVGQAGPAFVLVFDATGELTQSGGGANFNIADRPYFTELRDGAQWTVSRLIVQSALGTPIFGVAKRIEREGRFAGAAVLFLPADIFADASEALDLGPGSTVGLLRLDGKLVTRHPLPNEAFDLSRHMLFTTYLPNAASGIYRNPASPVDGEPRLIAYTVVQGMPLVVIASMSLRTLDEASMRRIWSTFAVAGPVSAIVLILCIGMAVLVLKQRRASDALAVAAAQNEMLLQEVHHRVKNNLQMVAAMIQLQPGDATAKAELSSRIRAMTSAHQLMYETSSFDNVDGRAYVERLAAALREGMAGRVTIVTGRLDAIRLAPDQVQPLGLIINEVVSNAFKHAFPDQRAGRIDISLVRVAAKEAELIIADNGVGMPFAPRIGMGSRLIQNLAEQLQGRVTTSVASGTMFTLRFEVA